MAVLLALLIVDLLRDIRYSVISHELSQLVLLAILQSPGHGHGYLSHLSHDGDKRAGDGFLFGIFFSCNGNAVIASELGGESAMCDNEPCLLAKLPVGCVPHLTSPLLSCESSVRLDLRVRH